MFYLGCIFSLAQDQLSADMYSFVAKEIDYANYFQTVRVQEGEIAQSLSESHGGIERECGHRMWDLSLSKHIMEKGGTVLS